MTKRERREYREYLRGLSAGELFKLRGFFEANGFPENRDEKLTILKSVAREAA